MSTFTPKKQFSKIGSLPPQSSVCFHPSGRAARAAAGSLGSCRGRDKARTWATGGIEKRGENESETSIADLSIGNEKPAADFPFRLDSYQQEAEEAIASGDSVLVSAPTGAGKTAIAEIALRAALKRGQRAIYTTPIKALSNQKLVEFQEAFGHENCGIITGDVKHQPEADVLVMTTEILRNILYKEIGHSQGRYGNTSRLDFSNVQVVVLDEVHYLGDEERGSVWEEVVIYLPRHVQMVCLSATLANSEEIVGWMRQAHGPTSLVKCDKRPVPLTLYWTLFDIEKRRNNFEPILKIDSLQSVVMSKYMRSLAHLKEPTPDFREMVLTLSKLKKLPAIWFIFRRKACDQSAIKAYKMLKSCNSNLRRSERNALYQMMQQFKAEHPESVKHDLVQPFLSGIASHHAGLLPAWKGLVEQGFQAGLIKLVFATHTLAMGVNMPCKTTVISELEMKRGRVRGVLTYNDIMQLAGRAGRRGFDKFGSCILFNSPSVSLSRVMRNLKAGPMPVTSSFKADYGMVLNLIDSMGADAAKELLKSSFLNYQCKLSAATNNNDAPQRLSESDFLRSNWIADEGPSSEMDEYEKVVEEFDNRVVVLGSYDALDIGSMSLLPLGRIAAKIHAENQLWIAIAATSPDIFLLNATELAGFVCALITSESLRLRSSTECSCVPSEKILRCLESLEPAWEKLIELQLTNGISQTPFMDARLAGLAEQWASGASWPSIKDSVAGLDEGDIVKVLHRTQDLLRQFGGLSLLPSEVAERAKAASNLIERSPLTDV